MVVEEYTLHVLQFFSVVSLLDAATGKSQL